MNLFDTNAWIGEWPLALVPTRDPAALQKHWKQHGITGGLVSAFSSLWVLDPTAANTALVKATARRANLVPLPVLNLLDPAWREQLETILSWSAVKAVRLAPGYGGWTLNSRAAIDAAKAIEAAGRRVVLTVRLVDERHEHPAVKIKPVLAKTIGRWIEAVPEMTPLLQGATRWELEELAGITDRFLTDMSYAEWTDTIGVLGQTIPARRIVFGSLTPLHVTLAHANKVSQSPVSAAQRRAIATGNAEKFLQR